MSSIWLKGKYKKQMHCNYQKDLVAFGISCIEFAYIERQQSAICLVSCIYLAEFFF